MKAQMVFKRYEQKYLITHSQKQVLLSAMQPYMSLDEYGRTTIRNVYFDTDSFRLIRRSIERPVYKEKLRIRSYGKTPPGADVFVELKKKYKKVVFKRRMLLPEHTAIDWLGGSNDVSLPDTQITREISYFRDFYGRCRPSMFLAYEREAYYSRDGSAFRVTFDENIRARTVRLTTEADDSGQLLLDEDAVLMEIKAVGGIPLWMTSVLSAQHIYKTSFSKYGTAYREIILQKGGHIDAKLNVSGDF